MPIERIIAVILVMFVPVTMMTMLFGKIKNSQAIIILTTLGILIVFFWTSNSITEFSINSIGSIKTNAVEASKYLEDIKIIKIQVDGVQEQISKSAADATKSLLLVNDLRTESAKAQEKIDQAAKNIDVLIDVSGKLTNFLTISTVILEAQSDNRSAYLELIKYSEDSKQPYTKLASESAYAIGNSAVNIILSYSVPWSVGVDISNLKIKELIELYRNSDWQVNARAGFIQYVGQRNDINVAERLSFLLEVIDNDSSLKVAIYSARTFGQLANMQNATVDLRTYDHWWAVNKSKL